MIDGLILTGVGMGIVFLVLAILMGVISLLGRWPTPREEAEVPPAEGAGTWEMEGAVVAAIAVALASTMKVDARRRHTAARPPSQPGHWASSGRRQLMDSRQRVKR